MLQGMSFSVRRIELEGFKDPDELLRQEGKEAFIERFKASIDGTEYMISHLSMDKAVEYLCSLSSFK